MDVKLTEAERDALCDALMDYTHTHTGAAPLRLDKYVVPTVEKMIAARLAASGPRLAGGDVDYIPIDESAYGMDQA